MRLFTAYRTYLQDNDLVGAKTLSADEWGEILDEALEEPRFQRKKFVNEMGGEPE